MQLLYFAWVRERIGRDGETLTLPTGVATVGQLLDHLAARGPGYAEALADRDSVRIAVNQDYAHAGHPVSDQDEVAIFPPVTGG
jgi:sulfur-carrier protein